MPLNPRAVAAIIARRQASSMTRPVKKPTRAKFSGSDPQIISCGATEVTRFGKETHIVHMGNEAATETDNVRRNFDKLFGRGAFAKVRPHGCFLTDPSGTVHSDPSRSYVLTIPNDAIDALAA